MITEPTHAESADLEATLRREEIALRRSAIELERAQLQSESAAGISKSLRAALPGVIAAMLGILGTGYVAYTQGRTNLALEQKRSEASLILKAIETGNQEQARANLLFLLEMGLISDPSGRMATKLATNLSSTPVLPSTSNTSRASWHVFQIKIDAESEVTFTASFDGQPLTLQKAEATFQMALPGDHLLQWLVKGTPGVRYVINAIDISSESRREYVLHEGSIGASGSDAGTYRFVR